MGEVVTTIPTIGFNVEQVSYKNLKFQVWDLGGQSNIRPFWRCYYSDTDAIIYVVDSADKDRIGISKDELLCMLQVIIKPYLGIARPRKILTSCGTVHSQYFHSTGFFLKI